MRILILANSDGGLYQFRKELLIRLIEKYEVIIAIPYGDFREQLLKLGCKIVDVDIERHGKNPLNELKLIKEFENIIVESNPSVVLTYTIKPNIYCGFICRRKKVPFIVNITGLGISLEKNDLRSRFLRRIYKHSIDNANYVFFQNESNKKLFSQNKKCSNYRLLPGSGVNLKEHCFEEYPRDGLPIVFSIIGRIMKDKGIDEVLEAARIIKKRYPEVTFQVIGNYDGDYKGIIEAANKNGYIKYLGMQLDIHPFIRDSHAIINASYHEGMSNVLLESASTGRPVIASNIPGCIETFTPGITGISFEPKNTKSLCKAIEEFINLPYIKQVEMGKRARDKMVREFDREIVVNKYMDAINSIVGGQYNESI